ncbi:MAG: FAD-binding oxidoreductase, partial [Planctomycetota bacterium]
MTPIRRRRRDDRRLLRALERWLPPSRIIRDPGECALYDTDGLTLHRAPPGGVLLLESADEVEEAVRCCVSHGVPFVPRGAGTGLSGGAIPLDHAWVLDLSRMDRVLEIDPLERTARIEPGVVNLDLDRAAAAPGRRFAPDPSSPRAGPVGGHIAEHSGGPHGVRHGMTTRHIESLEVVLPDGTRTILAAPSPGRADPRGLFVGSEGTLGIAVEATVALVARPEAVRTQLASFPSLAA